tara:strand:- start:302 stop:511 length:210 start_codon:yes stop_codon:yes gene_type:complete
MQAISKLDYYSKLLFDMEYIEVLKENGFNESGEPLKGCNNPEMTVDEIEVIALNRFNKRQETVEPFDFD